MHYLLNYSTLFHIMLAYLAVGVRRDAKPKLQTIFRNKKVAGFRLKRRQGQHGQACCPQ